MTRPAQLALALGIALGLALGLYIGWVASPVRYVDTEPASLRSDYKAEMTLMVAEAFSVSGDAGGAAARLAALGKPEQVLPAAFDQALRLKRPPADLRRLAALAAALGAHTPAMAEYLP